MSEAPAEKPKPKPETGLMGVLRVLQDEDVRYAVELVRDSISLTPDQIDAELEKVAVFQDEVEGNPAEEEAYIRAGVRFDRLMDIRAFQAYMEALREEEKRRGKEMRVEEKAVKRTAEFGDRTQ